MEEGTKVNLYKVGFMRAVVVVDGVKRNVFMEEVASVPYLMTNLVSVSRLRKEGLETKSTEDPDNCGNEML